MKVFIVKKKSLIAGILAVCFALVFIIAMANFIPTAVQALGQVKKIPIYCVDKSEKVVSLSFDAAWGNNIIGKTQHHNI